jgi:WD40 repeat protein
MQDLAGQQIKGYTLLERIGAGGFGAVYRAEQPQVGREVAVKIILPQYANHPDFIRRFEVEARVIARLEHPHIIPLYDYWRDPNGAYLVMRYLRGGSLRSRISQQGPLSLAETSHVLDQLAGALTVAHRHDVVHRDIKPDNILFDENGNTYLTDFGIAKDLSQDGHMTQADIVVGSPAYLSPEQVRAEAVTPRSDIYSLGLLLFEMLAGRHPYDEERPTSLLLKHLNEPMPPLKTVLADIPEGVERVLQRATAKDPEARYADVLTLAAAFRQAILLDDGSAAVLAGSMAPTLAPMEHTLLLDEEAINNPYKGLAAFEEVDTANFFGRENLVDRLLTRLREARPGEHFLAVIGPSGSGKSSVVKAGIIPRMRHGTLPGSARWFVVEMEPGMYPLEELEAALLRIAVNPPSSLLTQLKEDTRGLLRATKRILPDDRSQLFLFIDQFEEVFTQARDRDEVAHFLDSLVTAVTAPDSRLRVVITLRADFYDRPLLYPAFGDLVRRFTEVVLPMTAEELERAIVGPAQRVGVQLEHGLVNQIIADVSQQPGALPLLQYALTELFERREGRVLTLRAYHQIGGALGALARRADEVYATLDSDQQELARQLFLRMVTLGEGGAEDTRRRVTQTELASLTSDSIALDDVINAFDRSRLLTFDHDPNTRERTVEVAHEALIREWTRLQAWLTESREDLLIHRRLRAAVGDWQRAGHDASYLLTGARLSQYETWLAETDLALGPDEVAYLQASIAQREQQAARETERQAREAALEARSRARLRALVAVMAGAAVVALVLAALALVARNEAQANAHLAATAQMDAENNAALAATARAVADANRAAAERSAAEARGLALAANARNLLTQNDPSLALALAIEAYRAYQPAPAEVQQTLARAAYGPNVRFRLDGHRGSVLDVALNDTRGVSVSADGLLIVWDTTQGTALAQWQLEEPANSVDLSADSRRIVTGLFNGDIVLWDAASGAELARFSGHTDVVTRVVFSPDQTRILSGALDRTVRLWDIASGDLLLTIETAGAILNVVFSPDGQYAASSSADYTAADDPNDPIDRTIRVWNLSQGLEIQMFRPNSGFVRAIDYSPDGRFIASGTWSAADGGVVQLWNVITGRLERSFYGGHKDVISEVRFSADGQRLLSTSWDRNLAIWDVQTGVTSRRFEGHKDRILAADFDSTGQYVLVGTGHIGNNIPDPAADRVTDPAVWLWDLAVSRAEIARFDTHTDWVWAIAISPDGRYAASGSGPLRMPPDGKADTSVRLWNLQTNTEAQRFEGHTDTIHTLRFTPDGQQLASGSWDGSVRLWPLDGTPGRVLLTQEGRVLALDFSPDGTQIVTSGAGGSLRLWDVATGAEVRAFTGHSADVNGVAFSPDGRQIASASADRTVRLWDVASGQEIHQLTGHTDRVSGIAFSPDGTRLLTTAWDTTARLWDVTSGQEIRQLIGHSAATFGPSFSPDSRYVLTGSADTTVRLWDVQTGDEIRRYEGHTNWVLSTAFAPSNTFIMTGAEDNTARRWVLSPAAEDLIRWARANRYVPELTCAERAQYRVEPLCESSPD